MAITLASILCKLVKEEGKNLSDAKKDLKLLKNNRAGIKVSRKMIAVELRSLKAKRKQADMNGGGATSAALSSELNFLRKVLNELSEEGTMIRLQIPQCGAYIKAQEGKVRAIDAEWEKAKAAETASEITDPETAA